MIGVTRGSEGRKRRGGCGVAVKGDKSVTAEAGEKLRMVSGHAWAACGRGVKGV